jgi:uncharacterized protein
MTADERSDQRQKLPQPALPKAERYMNPYVAGAFLGVLLFLSVLATGHGLGASGGLARMLVAIEDIFVPGHVDATPSLAEMAGGPQNPLNNWVVFNVLGALLGGFVSGLLAKRVKLEMPRGPRTSFATRSTMALIGGALVGFGARMARGCTSGQALSGGAVLSVGSWAFMFAVFAGGYLLAYPVRRLWN